MMFLIIFNTILVTCLNYTNIYDRITEKKQQCPPINHLLSSKYVQFKLFGYFLAGTEAAKQAIWLQELLSEVMDQAVEKAVIRIDNQSAIALTKNPVFHGRSKYIHSMYHFIRECVEQGKIIVEHVSSDQQKADILTKALGRIKLKEMKDLIGMQDLEKKDFKLKGENVEINLKSK